MAIPLLVIGGIVAAKAVSGFLKSRASKKAKEEAQQLYNEYLAGRKSAGEELFAHVKENGFDPYGPQVTTSTGQEQSESGGTSRTSTTQDITPTLSAEYKALEGQWRKLLEGRLAGGTSSLPEGYLGAAARGTNEAFKGAQVAAQNLAARRGLSGEQAVSIGEPIEVARAGKIADVANQIPLLGRQLQNEDLGLAASLAERFGKGTSMRGTSATDTTGWSSGTRSGTVSAPPNLQALFNILAPPSPNAGKETGISTAGQVTGDLASAVASLYASGAFSGGAGGGGGGMNSINFGGSQAGLPG